MEETLQHAVSEILETTLSAKDFVISEIPEVVSQLLVWEACASAISCLAFILLVAVWGIGVNKLIKSEWWAGEARVATPALQLTVGVPSVFYIAMSSTLINLDWLKIWIAPKIFLIEYAADLVK